MSLILPFLLLFVFGVGLWKKQPVFADFCDGLVFGGSGVVHSLGKIGGNGNGVSNKVNSISVHFYILLFLLINQPEPVQQ